MREREAERKRMCVCLYVGVHSSQECAETVQIFYCNICALMTV